MEGGNESGFTEVETNAGAEKRLLKLSGCDNMRIEEVSIKKKHVIMTCIKTLSATCKGFTPNV